MRTLNANMKEISESEADLKKGKLYKKVIIKPDAVPVDNITKFTYEVDDYEEVLVFVLPGETILSDRIAELKKKLSDTDYVVIKIAEGAATAEEYSEVIASRQVWREEINQLEKELR